jgi:hypothetical protein
MSTPDNPGQLSPGQRKSLRFAVATRLQEGEALTLRKFCEVATAILGWKVGDQLGPELLAELGYAETKETEPQLSAAGGMEIVLTWAPVKGPKPMTTTERAQHVAARVSELTEAFVAEVLEDPELSDASLSTKATEMTRIFAAEMGRAVTARAKVGGKSILDQCAMIANIAFKGA